MFYNDLGYTSTDIQLYALNGQLIKELLSIPLEIDANVIPLELENLNSGGYQVILQVEKGKIFNTRFYVLA